jgi:orotidine-5'-phosphate decarboxylase
VPAQPPSAPVVQRSFGDLLSARVQERRSQLVLGVDPDPAALWPSFAAAAADSVASRFPAERVAARVLGHCRALIDATADACVAVKFQLACFERLGAPGWAALEDLVAHAHGLGLLVVADGKRGDIPVSAAAYAQALFGGTRSDEGELDGLQADLATVNPLLGREAMIPFVAAARERGGGVLALVRTSNPGAADVQDLALADGRPLWERLAEIVGGLGADGVGESGLSDVGAVVGATQPVHLERARALMPQAIFLLPGVGSQGGDVQALAGAIATGPLAEPRASALVTASRSIAGAYLARGGEPASAARGEAERLREQAWSLV